MSFSGLLTQTASHRRRTFDLFTASAFPFTASLSFTTAVPARLKANGTGLDTAVDLLLTGSLSGTPQTESMTVPTTAAQLKVSTKKWTAIDTVTSATVATGALSGRAIMDTGMEVASETVVSSALPCRLRRRRGTQVLVDPGNVMREEWVCYLTSTAVQLDDLLVIDNVTYEVYSVYPVYGRRAQHHVEAYVHRL